MRRRLISFSLLAALSMPVLADTLSMPDAPPPMGGSDQGEYVTPRMKTPAELLSLQMPARGMSMKAVEKKFGAPDAKMPAVGKPPITRWEYKDFTVYFEYQYVIQAVLNPMPKPAQEGAGAPAAATPAPAATAAPTDDQTPLLAEPPQEEPVQSPAQ